VKYRYKHWAIIQLKLNKDEAMLLQVLNITQLEMAPGKMLEEVAAACLNNGCARSIAYYPMLNHGAVRLVTLPGQTWISRCKNSIVT
jgi:hypothetical protein